MLSEEHAFIAEGYQFIAGVDEVGRGCWAGPVVAAAVMLDPAVFKQPDLVSGIQDSKTLSPQQRQAQVSTIQQFALAIGIGAVAAPWIDLFGISQATRIAMTQAILALPKLPQALLIDWVRLSEIPLPQRSFPKGDQRSVSIAAASIIAKVHRDTIMEHYGHHDPRYGWQNHKGYGTQVHRQALNTHGPSHLHRQSFRPVAQKIQAL